MADHCRGGRWSTADGDLAARWLTNKAREAGLGQPSSQSGAGRGDPGWPGESLTFAPLRKSIWYGGGGRLTPARCRRSQGRFDCRSRLGGCDVNIPSRTRQSGAFQGAHFRRRTLCFGATSQSASRGLAVTDFQKWANILHELFRVRTQPIQLPSVALPRKGWFEAWKTNWHLVCSVGDPGRPGDQSPHAEWRVLDGEAQPRSSPVSPTV